jgi:hypothetical protein
MILWQPACVECQHKMSRYPVAQKLSLGWVIVGEVCTGKFHKADTNVNSLKTNLLVDGRTTLFDPCHSKLSVREQPVEHSSLVNSEFIIVMNLRSSYDVPTSSSHWVLTNNEFQSNVLLVVHEHLTSSDTDQIMYLIDVHHVENQITGPQGAPFAQKLSLGWVIVGEVCTGKFHKADTNVNHPMILWQPACVECQHKMSRYPVDGLSTPSRSTSSEHAKVLLLCSSKIAYVVTAFSGLSMLRKFRHRKWRNYIRISIPLRTKYLHLCQMATYCYLLDAISLMCIM